MAENSAKLFEKIGLDGAHGLENPKDPNCEPFPTAWLLDAVVSYCQQPWSEGVDCDLCRFGWETVKPIHIHGHLRGVAAMGLNYNHSGGHPPLIGPSAAGGWKTTPAQRYTSVFSAALAELLVDTYAWTLGQRP